MRRGASRRSGISYWALQIIRENNKCLLFAFIVQVLFVFYLVAQYVSAHIIPQTTYTHTHLHALTHTHVYRYIHSHTQCTLSNADAHAPRRSKRLHRSCITLHIYSTYIHIQCVHIQHALTHVTLTTRMRMRNTPTCTYITYTACAYTRHTYAHAKHDNLYYTASQEIVR